MKNKNNFAREVQHFLLGAGLSLLVVAVTPVGASYLAQSTMPPSSPPSSTDSGSSTMLSPPPQNNNLDISNTTNTFQPGNIPTNSFQPNSFPSSNSTTNTFQPNSNIGVPSQCPNGEQGTPPYCSGALQLQDGSNRLLKNMQDQQKTAPNTTQRMGNGNQPQNKNNPSGQDFSQGRYGKPSTPSTDLEEGIKPGLGFGRDGGLGKIDNKGLGNAYGQGASEKAPSFVDDVNGNNAENGISKSRNNQPLIYGKGGDKGGLSKSTGGMPSSSFLDGFSDMNTDNRLLYGNKQGGLSQQKPSFGGNSESRFQIPVQKTSKGKKQEKLMIEDEEEGSDSVARLQDIKDAGKKIYGMKTRNKVQANVMTVFKAIEGLCDDEGLDCNDFLDSAAEDLDGASIKKMKKILKTSIGTLEERYNEVADEE